jgi:hypothetical protein
LGWIIAIVGFGFGGCLGLGVALGFGGAGGAGGGVGAIVLTILTGTMGPSLTRALMAAEREMIVATIATWAAEEPRR